jgi:hypothetical protein
MPLTVGVRERQRQQPRQKTNFAHFSNFAPQPPDQFRVVRPPFRYPVNDHTGGFETLPYIDRPPTVQFVVPANSFDNVNGDFPKGLRA